MSQPLPNGFEIPKLPATPEDQEIITALTGYKREAQLNRSSGENPRDARWQVNMDLYHNRYDFSQKADWQSKNTMPEVPSYVDRFAAALKEALVTTPNGFYTVTDPYDTENDLSQSIKKMNDVWLSVCGTDQMGRPLDFSAVFEEQMKLGAMMAACGVVIWRDDVPGGRVAFETVDPRQVWLDHTNRHLYRVRQTEIDLPDLARMVGMRTPKGKPVFNADEIQRLIANKNATDMFAPKSDLTGHGDEVTSGRKPILMDEYIASVYSKEGGLIMDNQLAVLADDEYLIRKPEDIPFWHKQDWLLYTPLITVPLSPYGRSYMEDFGSVAKVFTELTNLILDATYTASMNAYVLVPSMLKDPTQANTGVWPNKTFFLEEGYTAEEFAKALELGTLDAGAVQVWTNIKNELSEAASLNEIGLGQLPQKTHIASSAVVGAQQSQSAVLRSMAQTIEVRFLNPSLDLMWKTGLQHATPSDIRMAAAVGRDMYGALLSRRQELIKRQITFQAHGISGLIQRQQRLQSLLQVMQVIAQNENLVAAFMQVVDINKLLSLLFELSNVDLTKLTNTDRTNMINQVVAPMQQAGAGGQGSPAAMREMGDVASRMGIAQ